MLGYLEMVCWFIISIWWSVTKRDVTEKGATGRAFVPVAPKGGFKLFRTADFLATHLNHTPGLKVTRLL